MSDGIQRVGVNRLVGLIRGVLAVAVSIVAASASAGPTLKLGDILVAEPGTSSVSAIDAATGQRFVISQGGLLEPANKTVGVALALDGDVIVVHRETGLIRVNPVTGAQTILSQGGLFRDPWAIAVDQTTGAIYLADSGYDHDRPEVNEAGKIIRVDPATGAQELIAAGSPCNLFVADHACQNTTSAGSYLTHPYGLAVDYTTSPPSLIVADMGSFNGKGAIFRLQAVPNGTQTLLWGPSSAVPAPQVAQVSPVGCPMGVAVEPSGNILTSVFTYPVPPSPTVPPPDGNFYGCAPPGVYRIDLINSSQTLVNANAPQWQPNYSYNLGDVVRDETLGLGHVHRVVTAGVSDGAAPNWNAVLAGATSDGSVVWENIGLGANWQIPFGLEAEPAPTPSNPSHYNIVVAEEYYSAVMRLGPDGAIAGSEPLAVDTSNATSVDVITFTPIDGFRTEPDRFDAQPTGVLPSTTTQTILSLNTDVSAVCRYGTTAGVTYGSLPGSFASTGSTAHATTVTGLVSGTSYTFYVRCMDTEGNENTDDFAIAFVVANAPIAGPVAAYGFDGGNGTTVVDNSGHGNGGVLSGATWISEGRFGNALQFDGVDDWVTIPPSSHFDLAAGMTLEAWVFPTDATGVRDILIKEGNGADVYNLYARNWRGLPESNVFVGGGNHVAEGSELAVNTWSHVAGTYDGQVLTLFINGIQAATRPVTGAIAPSSGPLRIGGNSLWGEFFQGRIDEVRVYNRPLTAAEIQADMITPVDGSAPDSQPPSRFNGQPAGTLPWTTTQATLSLSTNEVATCRYALQPGVAYGAMPFTFTTTGFASHSVTVSGLGSGSSYSYYVRCIDSSSNVNTDDFVVSFAVASPSTAISSFPGTESPLSEGGMWDSPGTWADLAKSSGAFATGLNGQARLVAPLFGADQYSEILYDQNPGTGSWVGVTTRVQGAGNGSGYLAIAYAGEVRLYRADDTGGLNFTLLASAVADIASAPRRLRLESIGNTHAVYFNGSQLISHTDSGATYPTGQPGIAASAFGGPQVRILSFVGGDVGAADTVPPQRSNGQPAGTLPATTSEATLSLTTTENAICRFSTQAGVAFGAMPFTFGVTGSTAHSTSVSGLSSGNDYAYYVRCLDAANNANADDYVIAFTVAAPLTVTSAFPGFEAPLSEGALWSSAGAWSQMAKSDGAYSPGSNALARVVTPAVATDQYSEITYDQDPGSGSWVGVTTRVQGPADGSAYLAIVYAGEVRLYRADDTGALNFTLLATAPASVGTAPRRLRLESRGNNHRVRFNGVELINYDASGIVYPAGQPGIAASVFGGPQVRILSFEGGTVTTP